MEFYYCDDPEENCLTTLFTLDFYFEHKEFHCLVRAKAQLGSVYYHLTLLNPDMDEVFTEPYILTEKERTLFIETPIEKSEQAGVKFASVVALREHLVHYQAASQFSHRYIA